MKLLKQVKSCIQELSQRIPSVTLSASVLTAPAIIIIAGAIFFTPGCGLLDPDGDGSALYIDTEVVWGESGEKVVLKRDVVITEEGRLEIRPGTEIELVAGSIVIPDPAGNMYRSPDILVLGSIVCEGLADSRISFVNTDPMGSGGNIHVKHRGTKNRESKFRWTSGINKLRVSGGTSNIKNCSLTEIFLDEEAWVAIDSCQLREINAFGGKGIISNNTFTNVINVYNDSLTIDSNIFQSNPNPIVGVITCRHNSQAIITGNVIEDCAVGILVWGSSPSAHENNFINNGTSLAIISEEAQADTLDFSGNWWGTTDESEISEQISFWSDTSNVFVNFLPPAEDPFGVMPPD